MIETQSFTFNPFGENTYLIWDTTSGEAAIIDPGMSAHEEEKRLDRFILDKRLQIKATLLTHLHIDHTFGVDYVKKYNAPLMAHRDDDFLGQRRLEQARMFHLPMELTPIVVDKFIDEGEVTRLGDEKVMALHAPGHSPGSLLYYLPSAGTLFTGDVLFQRSIGRTDLPGGNHGQLISSIHKTIIELPPSTKVYPGHGPATTIGDELRFNPYF